MIHTDQSTSGTGDSAELNLDPCKQVFVVGCKGNTEQPTGQKGLNSKCSLKKVFVVGYKGNKENTTGQMV